MSGRPEPLVFFTDRDLGKRFPDILSAAGLSVERHLDHFRHDCPDDVWLEQVGNRGWIAVTHDQNIRYKPNELAAVVRHHVRLLVVVGKAPHAQLAESFVNAYSKIEVFSASHVPPWIAKVYRPAPAALAKRPHAAGQIVLWYP